MKIINQKIMTLLLVCYSILLCSWMFIGVGRIRRYTYPDYMYNLKPFVTINHFLQTDRFNMEIWVVNIFGNIGVFVPFGILIPIVFGNTIKKSFILFFIGLFMLESLQFLSRRGSFDVDDLILNSVGFVIGYGLYSVLSSWIKSRSL